RSGGLTSRTEAWFSAIPSSCSAMYTTKDVQAAVAHVGQHQAIDLELSRFSLSDRGENSAAPARRSRAGAAPAMARRSVPTRFLVALGCEPDRSRGARRTVVLRSRSDIAPRRRLHSA